MGTSSSSRGPGSRTPVVPTWLENPKDGAQGQHQEGETPQDRPQQGDEAADRPRPAILPPPAIDRFRNARGNFTRFARSGGSDPRALRRALNQYVTSGTGGGRNATLRMGGARTAAGRLVGVLRGFQRDGVAETLRRFNLQNFVGRPPSEVFQALTEIICGDQTGGPVDEAIARDAWLETIVALPAMGIEDLPLDANQMREMFIEYVSHAIQIRIMQDIGSQALRVAPSLAAAENIQGQLLDYVRLAVRDGLVGDMSGVLGVSDERVRAVVDRAYEDAFDLLQARGEEEG